MICTIGTLLSDSLGINIFQPYVSATTYGLSSKNNQWIIDLRERKKRARVHFIPDLKVGVFVTLRAPYVI
ncbi:MAG: hypothetical protein E4G89_01475, partial [Methanothrix sp.]